MLYSDRTLAQRLERTEGASNAAFVEARARLQPDSGAQWREVGGAYAMFDGPDSPLTQTFGLGLFAEAEAEHLAELEEFFLERGAPVFHEISPLADASLLALLNQRGYQPIEYTSVLYLPLPLAPAAVLGEHHPQLHTRLLSADEAPLWASVSAAGWASEMQGLDVFMQEFGLISAQSIGARPFLAELAGQPIATGALFVQDDAVLLAGASTTPAGRRQGGQQALLAARLHYAANQGCTLAMMGALPGSQSQRNAEKHGFRIAYTRTKWQLVRS
ncbi:GNAT family N-acetyltransferase [Hymenobacter lutimineralis]|uniref:GNAT family N-acetyltransferase n=1 Tax=Hymenobacter lutimineralis TaxID=2606448 RepID=A0A5D6VG64_9BACT|nr:GNAT family N-acetyltransferase [Hymenobacter lutimineralis]TYZ14360.1 GNAT family N-acetyltransferase [Hymenobacter lutimineralis]